MFSLAAISQVRLTSRKLGRRRWAHANGSTFAKEPKNAVPLRILVPCTVVFHVDAHTGVKHAWREVFGVGV